MMGERRDTPPLFAARPFAASVLLYEILGESEAADRMRVLVSHLERPDDYPPSWSPWTARFLSRRGRHGEARAQLEQDLERGEGSQRGLLFEALCDVVGEQAAWADVPAVLARAREDAAHGGLLALPLFADRLEGLAAEAAGDVQAARAALSRAAEGFATLEARWEAALSEAALARVCRAAGDHEPATSHARHARAVFQELGAPRELEQLAGR